jgi:hypothetical protein
MSDFPQTFPGEDGMNGPVQQPDVEVQAGQPTIDSRVPMDPHLQHLLELAQQKYPATQNVQQDPSIEADPLPVPDEQKNTVKDTALGALKLWRDTVHKGGEAFGEGLAGVAGFDPKDPLLGSSGVSSLPEGQAVKEVGSMAAQGAMDAPMLALLPETGAATAADLAAEYMGKGVMEHVAPHAPGLAKVLSKAAHVGMRAALGTGEASAYSAADAAASGGSKDDVKNAALSKMNLLGAAAGGGHALLGVTHPEGLRDLAGDADNAVASGHSEVTPLGAIQPSEIHFTADPEGKPILRVMEHRDTGAMKHADIPLDEAPGLQTAKEYLKQSPAVSRSHTPEGMTAMNRLDPRTAHDLLTSGFEFGEGDGFTHRPDQGAVDMPENSVVSKADSPRALQTEIAPEVADTTASPPRDNIGTDVLPGVQGHAMLAGPDGHVRFEPIPSDAPMPLGDEPKTAPLSQFDIYNNKGQPSVMGGSGKPEVPNIPPEAEAKLRDGIDTVRMLMHPEARWKGTPFEGLTHDMHRGPQVAQELKQQMYAARSIGNEAEMVSAMKNAMPDKKFFTGVDKHLEQVGLGRMSFEEFRTAHPEVGQHMIELYKNVLDKIDANSTELEQRGLIPEGLSEARAGGDRDRYLAASYMAHILPPGKWKPPTAAVEAAMDKIRADHPGMSAAQQDKQFLKLIGFDQDGNPSAANMSAGSAGNRLKAKDYNLPQTTKDVLGEVHSGALRAALTFAHQETLVGQLRAWDAIAGSEFFSHDPKPGWTHVPPSSMFGAVKDGYLSPDVAGLLDTPQIDKQPVGAMKYLQLYGKYVKANWTVRNATAQLNNMYRNVKASMMTDGLRLHEPIASGMYFKNAVGALADWKKSPIATDAMSSWVKLAREHEALPSGYGKVETMAPGGVFEDMLKDIAPAVIDAKGKAQIQDLMNALKENAAVRGIKAADQHLKEWYDGTDQVFKLANFMAGVERLEKRGISREQAAATMGRRINESFPNYEHVGPVVDKVRKTPFGAVAPMLSGFTEDMRNNYAYSKVLGRAATDPLERERVVSMLKQVGMIGGAMALGNHLRRLNGIPDSEVEAAKGMRTQQSSWYHPANYAMPFRDGKGRVVLVDPTNWLPDLQYGQGNPDDALWKRIAANLVAGPFQSSLAEKTVQDGAQEALGLHGRYEPKLMEGEGGPSQFIQDHLLQQMVPGLIQHGYQALRRAGVVGHLGRNEAKMTGPEAAASLFQTGIQPVGVSTSSKAYNGAHAEAYGQMKQLTDDKKRLFKRSMAGGDLADDPKRFKELRDKNDARMKQIQDRVKHIDSMIQAANKDKGMTK